jgi:hypothetical protein
MASAASKQAAVAVPRLLQHNEELGEGFSSANACGGGRLMDRGFDTSPDRVPLSWVVCAARACSTIS